MTAPAEAQAEAPAPAEQPKKPTIEELFARLEAAQSENAKAINVMAAAIVKLNEKIEAKPNPDKAEGSDWVAVLRELVGGGKSSSLEEAAKHVGGLVKFAEEMDRFRHPYDYEGALAKRLLWRHGLRSGGGMPRYMTKEELKRYDKYLDRTLGLEEEQSEEGEEHVREEHPVRE